LNPSEPSLTDRVISLGNGLPAIPERLLLAHARGEVLFICGAGISRSADLPDFRELVLDVYGVLDKGVHAVLASLPRGACNQWEADCSSLTERQKAEVKRFIIGDYDVVLGMLERRLDDQTRGDSSVRREVAKRLRSGGSKAAPIHRALMRLADRGGATTIVTTNFDLLLEVAGKHLRSPAETYSLGSIPRPTRQTDFAGVLHIHGVLDAKPERFSELVLSDQDFGEFYLRRRVVPDFIYDAARLFHLVLVGYSANDPPMRYLLNAVAADGTRFDDLKERFIIFGTDTPDPVALEDWKARGITPVHYDANNNHSVLCETLERWSELSAINGKKETVDAEIRGIVKATRTAAPETDRDLFDHFFRRSNASERVRLSALASDANADLGWLDAIMKISTESEWGYRS
jgi:SIR2-like domain